MSDNDTLARYPNARKTRSWWRVLLWWGSLPPGTTQRKVEGHYLFVYRGRYLARDGVWRTPKSN